MQVRFLSFSLVLGWICFPHAVQSAESRDGELERLAEIEGYGYKAANLVLLREDSRIS